MIRRLFLLLAALLWAAQAHAQIVLPGGGSGGGGGSVTANITCPTSTQTGSTLTFTNSLTDLSKTGSYAGSWTTDCGAWVKFTCTAACTYTLPAPSTDGNYIAIITNTPGSSNSLTIAAGAGQINGGASISLAINQSVSVSCDTTNCYAATVASPAVPQMNMGYVSGLWYQGLFTGSATGNAWTTAGNLECSPYVVSPPGLTGKALGVDITTADASNFVSMALYTSVSGRPGALIDSIGGTANAATPTGASSAALANTTDVLAAGGYWFCAAANSTTMVLQGISTSSVSGLIGASAIGSAATIVGLVCTGGAAGCGPSWAAAGGSSYTWPASLASATWTQKIVSGQAPMGFVQSN